MNNTKILSLLLVVLCIETGFIGYLLIPKQKESWTFKELFFEFNEPNSNEEAFSDFHKLNLVIMNSSGDMSPNTRIQNYKTFLNIAYNAGFVFVWIIGYAEDVAYYTVFDGIIFRYYFTLR